MWQRKGSREEWEEKRSRTGKGFLEARMNKEGKGNEEEAKECERVRRA